MCLEACVNFVLKYYFLLNNLFSKVLATLRLTDTGVKYIGILWLMKQKRRYKSSLHPPWHHTFINLIIHTFIERYRVAYICTFIFSDFQTFKSFMIHTFIHACIHTIIQKCYVLYILYIHILWHLKILHSDIHSIIKKCNAF